MTSAHTKGLTYFPTNVGKEQEYWYFLSPQHSAGSIGQDKGKDIRWQDTSNAKAWGKSLRRLNRPQGVTPVYWEITNKSPSPREGGWVILKLNCYKLCALVQAARIMPCDSVLRFI